MPFLNDTDNILDVGAFLDGRRGILREPVAYLDVQGIKEDGEEVLIEVPVGFVTDYASVPRPFWNILPPTGRYGRAAVVHDYLYATGTVDHQAVSRGYCDRVFRVAMEDLGVNWFVRWTMFSAVRAGGGRVWNRYRKANQLEATV